MMFSISVATVGVETWAAYFWTLLSTNLPRIFARVNAPLNEDDDAFKTNGVSRKYLDASMVVSNTSRCGVVKSTPAGPIGDDVLSVRSKNKGHTPRVKSNQVEFITEYCL